MYELREKRFFYKNSNSLKNDIDGKVRGYRCVGERDIRLIYKHTTASSILKACCWWNCCVGGGPGR